MYCYWDHNKSLKHNWCKRGIPVNLVWIVRACESCSQNQQAQLMLSGEMFVNVRADGEQNIPAFWLKL